MIESFKTHLLSRSRLGLDTIGQKWITMPFSLTGRKSEWRAITLFSNQLEKFASVEYPSSIESLIILKGSYDKFYYPFFCNRINNWFKKIFIQHINFGVALNYTNNRFFSFFKNFYTDEIPNCFSRITPI